MIPFVLGVLFEVGGYAARSISVEKPTGRKIGLPPYLAQSLFIILAPALMAATFYMCFGRLITCEFILFYSRTTGQDDY